MWCLLGCALGLPRVCMLHRWCSLCAVGRTVLVEIRRTIDWVRLGVCGLISHRIDFGSSPISREFCLVRVREGRLQIAKLKPVSCGEREYWNAKPKPLHLNSWSLFCIAWLFIHWLWAAWSESSHLCGTSVDELLIRCRRWNPYRLRSFVKNGKR